MNSLIDSHPERPDGFGPGIISLTRSERLAIIIADSFSQQETIMQRPTCLAITNGARASLSFSQSEYQTRVATLRVNMQALELSAVVLTSMPAIAYYSGFLYCGFGRPYALLITLERVCLIAAQIDGGQPWRRSWAECISYTDWQQDNYFKTIAEQLRCTGSSKVGLELDQLNVQSYNKLCSALEPAKLSDVSTVCMHQRMTKSTAEIELIRAAAQIADLGGKTCQAAMQQGAYEYEVAQAGVDAMQAAIAQQFPDSELRDTWAWIQSGINTDGAHNPLTTRALAPGDIISLNTFPMLQGYYAALERTMFLDHCESAALRYWEVNCEVHRRGLELLKPGARCGEIAAELNEIYARADLLQYRSFGYGHSFGLLSHYYGREAGLELREDVPTELMPGMVISMEPMINIPDGEPGAGGYREHDMLVITETGNENLTHFPFGPEHNIIETRT